MILKGGIEIIASSGTFGVRRSGRGSVTVSATANRTVPRLTWAYSVRLTTPFEPYSSVVASVMTMKGSSAPLRMSVIRCWRVRMVPRMTNASVYRTRLMCSASPPIIIGS